MVLVHPYQLYYEVHYRIVYHRFVVQVDFNSMNTNNDMGMNLMLVVD